MLDMIFGRFLWDAKITGFHSYPSCVQQRIIEISPEETGVNYALLMKEMVGRAKEFGIKAASDNKIAFEMEVHGHKMFLGFFDGSISLGFKVTKW